MQEFPLLDPFEQKRSYFISHDSCHRASDFVILLCLSIRAQENEQEPDVFQQVVRIPLVGY